MARILNKGDRGRDVKLHQIRLNHWARRLRLSRCREDGVYGKKTANLNRQVEYLLGFLKPDRSAGGVSQAQVAKYHKRRTPGSRRQRIRSAKRRAQRRAYLRAGVFHRSMLNGYSGNINRACKRAIVRGHRVGLVTTSTYRTWNSWSLHGKGRAVDQAGSWNAMVRFQGSEWRRGGHTELIGPTNDQTILNGSRTGLSEGSGLETQHDNHVHTGF